MFRNYLVTALRNLGRNRLYGAITILGLAVAFTAAILIGQFVRGEFSYDTWIPGYRQVYRITGLFTDTAHPPTISELAPPLLKGQLKAAFPGATAVTRLIEHFPTLRHRPGDETVVDESFAWVDPDFFDVLPLPALAGDLKSAFQQPDAVVITRRIARKFFGRDLPIGDTLKVQGMDQRFHALRVTAVLKDLPSNTNFNKEIFANGRAAYSLMSYMDQHATYRNTNLYTFVRLGPAASVADLQRALDLASLPVAAQIKGDSQGSASFSYRPTSLPEAHFLRPGVSFQVDKPAGNRGATYAIAGLGALIVLVAAINFITLVTARAGRRAVEVGVRKTTGAGRGQLVIQFVGEAQVQVVVSALIAAALSELLIGPFGAFARRGLSLDFLHDPILLIGTVGSTLLVGLLAAIYPAFVLSGFRPAAVLKGGSTQLSGSPLARQALVVVQFAVLVGLMAATATVYRQTQFALARGLGGADRERILQVIAACENAFPIEVRKLPGVSAAACSDPNALNTPAFKSLMPVKVAGGGTMSVKTAHVGFGFFEVYGARAMAGRLFSPMYGQDAAPRGQYALFQQPVVINETAARRLGFSDPRAAVGRQMAYAYPRAPGPASPALPALSEIIGVVPDMPESVQVAAEPAVYFATSNGFGILSVKLNGQDVPGTIRAIQAVWKLTGNGRPIKVSFLSQYQQTLYLDLIIQGGVIAIGAGLAVLIACLGLFALSAHTTERRTKEIGVRKVMGAATRDIVLLLLWQFSIPVVAAAAIAIPIGFLAMDWWLHGFAYHVPLSAWTFVLAAAAAVAIAWFTVSWQSFIVARAKPAGALRYE